MLNKNTSQQQSTMTNDDAQAQTESLAMLARHGFTAVGLPRMLEINGVKRAIYNGERVSKDEK